MEQHQLEKKNSGFVALIVVLVFNAIGIALAISLLFRNNLLLDNISAIEGMTRAKAYANVCSEEALLAIKNETISTSREILLKDGKCSYQIIKQEDMFSVKSMGIFTDFYSKELLNIEKNDNHLHITYYGDDF